MLFNTDAITLDELKEALFTEKKVKLYILRLDKIHPVISGNKLFKLHYFLAAAVKNSQQSIVTFGGAYSNHLVATAFACKQLNIQCKGIVRGEEPKIKSTTILECAAMGMELEYISREQYSKISKEGYASAGNIIIPEGGYHPTGARGAALIMDLITGLIPTHICTAMGTATTLAGLLLKASPAQKIIGVPVIKGASDINERLKYLTQNKSPDNLEILDGYHFGGYAKKTPELISFMNQMYKQHLLPTDFVYTAKMLFGVTDKIKQDYFNPGSTIICLHTGGLQGNSSLPPDSLIF